MRKNNVRGLCGVLCAVVLAGAGCAGGGANSPGTQSGTSQEAESAEEEAPAGPAAPAGGESAQQTGGSAAPEAAGEDGQPGLYESKDGWTVQYDNEVISPQEEASANRVTFLYTGESGGDNFVEVTYFPDQSDQEALYNVMAQEEGLPEHVRYEDYFAGRGDVWSLRTMVDTVGEDGEPMYLDYIAVEHNGGALVLELVRQVEMDEAAEQRIDDSFSYILDSFVFTSHEPQTQDEYVWGKYTGLPSSEGIEGQPDGKETFVLMNPDHTGTICLQDEIPIIWYRRDGVVLNALTYEQIYEYVVEGDSLYLISGEQTLEFQK